MPERPKEPSTSMDHQNELRVRALGYSFGGPSESWCESDAIGIDLPVNPSAPGGDHAKYSGCLKYSTCNLITDSVRWKSIDIISKQELSSLKSIGCLRSIQASDSLLQEQNGGQFQSSDVSRNWTCPIGGCITPERQRDFEFIGGKRSFAQSTGCPFHSIRSSSQAKRGADNPLRFAQCYVTMPDFRSFLRENDVVVVAPIFRSIEKGSEPGDAYWYPFHSGYSFLQLPTREPGKDWNNLDGTTLRARWLLTQLSREVHYRSRKLPITRLFENAEEGDLITGWERDSRILSVSEGQATILLLQWVVLRRLLAAVSISRGTLDITQCLIWNYASNREQFSARLSDLSQSNFELHKLFGITRTGDDSYVREATLYQDLQLLGLLDGQGNPTARVELALRWLASRLQSALNTNDVDGKSLDKTVEGWAAGGGTFAKEVCSATGLLSAPCPGGISKEKLSAGLAHLVWLSLVTVVPKCVVQPAIHNANWENLKGIKLTLGKDIPTIIDDWLRDNQGTPAVELSPHSRLCRMVPQLHILIRAWWNTPLRWLFVPLEAVPPSNDKSARIATGLIIMMEDSANSFPYDIIPETRSTDGVISKLSAILPVLSLATMLEGAGLREEFVWRFLTWEASRSQFAQVGHHLKTIREMWDLNNSQSPESSHFKGLLEQLQSQFPATLSELSDKLTGDRVAFEVCAKDVAIAAVDRFNDSFWTKFYPKIELDLTGINDSTMILVRPFEGRYAAEDLSSRAKTSMVDYLNIALMERVKHADQGCVRLRIYFRSNDRVQFEMRVPGLMGIHWSFPEQDLGYWPWGRGFRNYFGNMVGLGAVCAGIFDDNGNNQIVIYTQFEATNREVI